MNLMSEPLIKPFKGLLYNREKIDDISRCVCPPYDIIPDPSLYYARSPYNAIRLELPTAEGGFDPYETARRTLDGWLAEKILCFDGEDTVYVYEQEFAVNGVLHKRTGIVPLVRLDRERILTHEETRQKAREDRERLIERLTTFTSLIFAMYEDESKEIEGLITGSEKERLYEFTDDLLIRNRFYRMTRAQELGLLSSLMSEKNLYIADGHHRLSVSFKLGLPYVAIYLTNMHSDGISILPYHRIIKLGAKKGIREILRPLEMYFDVSDVSDLGEGTIDRLIDNISASPKLSFLLYSAHEKPSLFILEQKRPLGFDPGSHEILRKLRVNAVHSGVLKHLMGIRDDEISFLNEPKEAMALIDEGEYNFAVFVPATSVREVRDIADNHLYMPPKSTYFYPKVISGLVFHKYV
jgi:uncharacterized protein (DUF1015 family)